MRPRVLITDGTHRNTLAILRSISPEMQAEVTSGISATRTLCSYSKHSHGTVRVPSINDREAYGRRLLEILAPGSYDYFLPVGLGSCLAASWFKDELSARAHCLLPDWRSMEIAYNKDRTMAMADEAGVPIPRTVDILEVGDLQKVEEYPIVLKSSEQHSVHYCRSLEEARLQYLSSFSGSGTRIIAQELITGYGCGFYGVFHRGRLMDFYLHKRLREFPITGGASAAAESYRSEKLFELGKRLGEALRWDGPIMFEFKHDRRTGDYKLMEANPKLWGSLDLTLSAGVDVPRLIFGIADGSVVDPIASRYEEAHYRDVRFRWPFPDQFKVLCARPGWRSVRELLFCKGLTNIDLNDPLPNLLMTMNGVLAGAKILVNEKERYPHGRRPTD